MSKNIFDMNLNLENYTKASRVVRFGGEIVVGCVDLTNDYSGVILFDAETNNEIGSKFIGNITGDSVFLAFNNPESVDVVIQRLTKIKLNLEKKRL